MSHIYSTITTTTTKNRGKRRRKQKLFYLIKTQSGVIYEFDQSLSRQGIDRENAARSTKEKKSFFLSLGDDIVLGYCGS